LTALADRSYFKGEEILQCERSGINALVPKPQTSNSQAKGQFDKRDFRYIPADDEYRCPAGHGDAEDVRRVERVGSDSIACACANGPQYDKRSFSRKIVVAIRNFGVSFALSALLTGTLANAAPVALLKDINAETQARSSFPSYLGTVGAHTLFVTKAEADAELGLWRTDGTSAGTVRVAAETASTSFSTARPLGNVGSRVLWIADTADGTAALWASDLTSAGTSKLANLDKTVDAYFLGDGNNTALLPSGVVVFAVPVQKDQQSDTELWRTDGTAGGTWKLATLGSSTFRSRLGVVGDRVFFVNRSAGEGVELWVTDASNDPSHTRLEIDLLAGAESSQPDSLTEVAGALYFKALTNGRWGLWRRDPSGAFLQLASEVSPPWTSQPLCAASGIVYFSVQDNTPWRTDGTPAGTFALQPAGTKRLSQSHGCVAAGNKMFLLLFQPTPLNPAELWVSDGTLPGTTQVALPTGVGAGDLMLWSGSHLFFVGYAGGDEIWATDGTTLGTHRVVNRFADGDHFDPTSQIVRAGSQIFVFARHSDLSAAEIWRADLDGGNSQQLLTTQAATFGLAANGKLFFGSWDLVLGLEPAASDGTVSGTKVLRDIAPAGNGSSFPSNLVTLGDVAIFGADDGVSGRELWRTDGTTAGTARLADINPGSGSSQVTPLVAVDGVVYFNALDSSAGSLWSTDGTSAGTHRLGDAMAYSSCDKWLKLGAFVYFPSSAGSQGTELWRTDGTPGGTQFFADLYPGSGSNPFFPSLPNNSYPCPVAVIGSTLYFVATSSFRQSGTHDFFRIRNVWRTDGTIAGTRELNLPVSAQVANVAPAVFREEIVYVSSGPEVDYPSQVWHSDGETPRLLMDAAGVAWIEVLSDRLYIGVSGGSAPGIYSWSGGTSTPTQVVSNIGVRRLKHGPASSRLGRRIVFVGTTPTDGDELFVTDGTAAGTIPITDVSAAGEAKIGGLARAVGPALYFHVNGGLARTDGTLAGFEQLTQSAASSVGVAGGQVVFVSGSPQSTIGTEIYVLPNEAPRAVADSASAVAGQAVTINVAANDTDSDGRVIASSVQVTDGPASGTVSIDAQGVVMYVANASFRGTDTFRYVVGDNGGAQSTPATVTVSVIAPPPSTAPSGGRGGGGAAGWLLISVLALATAMRRHIRGRAKRHVVAHMQG
jgi:ELWxxDGT repeat protein